MAPNVVSNENQTDQAREKKYLRQKVCVIFAKKQRQFTLNQLQPFPRLKLLLSNTNVLWDWIWNARTSALVT